MSNEAGMTLQGEKDCINCTISISQCDSINTVLQNILKLLILNQEKKKSYLPNISQF